VIQFRINPTRDGELFVFVNDAVIGIPGLYGLLYRQNTGGATLTIERLK
jgi:succinate dehydrogenase/fumarate reductase flavoprotein subunit